MSSNVKIGHTGTGDQGLHIFAGKFQFAAYG